MATFVLVPGAGGEGEYYWRRLVAELEARGHRALAVDIQGDDPALGLPEYAAITDGVIGEHRDVVLVAQSMGGFTAPMLGKRAAVARIVLVNAMIPVPGETPGQWFEVTGADAARRARSEAEGWSLEFADVFLHDLDAEARAEMAGGGREPSSTPFGQPCTFDEWPDVPIHVLAGADDRMFPADFQARVARERLGREVDVLPGGHLNALSRPAELADRLVGYLEDVPFELAAAAAEVRALAGGVRDDQLGAATPCAGWTVRDLLAHLGNLARAFTRTARHEPAGPRPAGPAVLADGWRERLGDDLDALVRAWREPSAWRGESEAGGVTLPSARMAAVALDELVLHGWDLAQATGQEFTVAPGDVTVCTAFASAVASPEGSGSLFGPAAAPGTDPTPLDSLLALAGRTTAWRDTVPA
jgi:uncharacterized protein (TIGR03086 family)